MFNHHVMAIIHDQGLVCYMAPLLCRSVLFHFDALRFN